MSTTRTVTEEDFRMPEYQRAKVEDYEFRADGKLVRKDRWETGIRRIEAIVGRHRREGFEIPELIAAIEAMEERAYPKGQCSNDECGWLGRLADCTASGAIPCCPECGEKVEPRATNADEGGAA
ncbi:hypothetical protein [Variovorax boronicumulans]|uniref:hypothetical protein n=1 Tax=Variovorax boronicumulans TaxID=436515 RepID=UPI0012E68D6F|nr:hypothetical protein [Variovorax boronicumulans]GER16737.1 hypothetical protein VCH24_17440 [Variovorax boronicumulans]